MENKEPKLLEIKLIKPQLEVIGPGEYVFEDRETFTRFRFQRGLLKRRGLEATWIRKKLMLIVH